MNSNLAFLFLIIINFKKAIKIKVGIYIFIIKNKASITAMNMISIGFIENLNSSNIDNSFTNAKEKENKHTQNKMNFKIPFV